jgi:hypothetical protein
MREMCNTGMQGSAKGRTPATLAVCVRCRDPRSEDTTNSRRQSAMGVAAEAIVYIWVCYRRMQSGAAAGRRVRSSESRDGCQLWTQFPFSALGVKLGAQDRLGVVRRGWVRWMRSVDGMFRPGARGRAARAARGRRCRAQRFSFVARGSWSRARAAIASRARGRVGGKVARASDSACERRVGTTPDRTSTGLVRFGMLTLASAVGPRTRVTCFSMGLRERSCVMGVGRAGALGRAVCRATGVLRVRVEDIAGVGDGARPSGYCVSEASHACGRRGARGNPRQQARRTLNDVTNKAPPHP